MLLNLLNSTAKYLFMITVVGGNKLIYIRRCIEPNTVYRMVEVPILYIFNTGFVFSVF